MQQATEPYTLFLESSFDSFNSDQTLLQCDELLLSERPAQRHVPIKAPTSPALATRSFSGASIYALSPQETLAADAALMIR